MSNEDFCGVYRIVNNINCKLYIGSSIHVNKRLYEHKSTLKSNSHHNSHLQRAWNKYGEENFSFEILETIDGDIDTLRKREQYWIDYYKSYDLNAGYNISHSAVGNSGHEISEETKEKIRNKTSGVLNHFYGKSHTEETRKKMSENHANVSSGNHPRAKSVLCVELDMIFDCTRDAERKLGVNHAHISACCKGRRKTAGGYHWYYIEENEVRW